MYKHLFVPVDGSELTRRAVEGSIALAKQLGASITGFVVEPDLPLSTAQRQGDAFFDKIKDHEDKNEAHAAAVLGLFAEHAAAAGVPFHAHHVTAYVIDQAIMEEAEKKGCDMIVMVTHGRNALGEFVFGSQTKNVVARCKLPVLVLH